MTGAHAEELERELATCQSAPSDSSYEDYKALTAHDARLHELILCIADNAAVRQAFRAHALPSAHLRLAYNQPFGEQTMIEHRAIVDALVSGRQPQRRRRWPTTWNLPGPDPVPF